MKQTTKMSLNSKIVKSKVTLLSKTNVKNNLLFVLVLSLLVTININAQVKATDSPTYKAAVKSRTPFDPNFIWTASHTALLSEEVAPRIYAVFPDSSKERNRHGDQDSTTSGFVVGDNGVLVIDTQINRRLAEQLIGIIREKTDKPILFIVNTNYHGDQSYGFMFFPKGVQISYL